MDDLRNGTNTLLTGLATGGTTRNVQVGDVPLGVGA